jgi:hypothetical protein
MWVNFILWFSIAKVLIFDVILQNEHSDFDYDL